jgi:phosphoribosyl 1,2-cyclic phosphodiesterase
MYIRCWGSRGSIPVSGKDFLRYGGDTTCIEIRSKENDLILIDAGTGLRNFGNSLAPGDIKNFTILFTHAHWDHIMGLPFFWPLYAKGTTITMRGNPFGYGSYREIFAGIMRSPYFPVELTDKDIRAKLIFKNLPKTAFNIGNIRIETVPLSHPKNGGTGFRFEEDGKSFVFLTDNELGFVHDGGLMFDDYVEFARDADLLIHDGEYTNKDYKAHLSWGHSLFIDAVKLGIKAKAKKMGIFHLNSLRTDKQVDAIVRESELLIKAQKSTMKCFGVSSSFSTTL